MFEMTFMRAIAKGFVLRAAAAADADDLAATKAIGRSIAVDDFEISFQFD